MVTNYYVGTNNRAAEPQLVKFSAITQHLYHMPRISTEETNTDLCLTRLNICIDNCTPAAHQRKDWIGIMLNIFRVIQLVKITPHSIISEEPIYMQTNVCQLTSMWNVWHWRIFINITWIESRQLIVYGPYCVSLITLLSLVCILLNAFSYSTSNLYYFTSQYTM